MTSALSPVLTVSDDVGAGGGKQRNEML